MSRSEIALYLYFYFGLTGIVPGLVSGLAYVWSNDKHYTDASGLSLIFQHSVFWGIAMHIVSVFFLIYIGLIYV